MYYIGIDLGGTYTKMALVKNGKVLTKTTLGTMGYTRRKLIDKIIDSVNEILLRKGLKKRDIRAIGMGLPGLIDSRRGVVRYLVNIPGWKDIHLKSIMEKELKIKTYLDNDVNVMTLGELYYGAGKNAGNMISLTLGTGVGGGIVIDGKLYRGTDLAAGEIGHVPINEKGPRCNCGGIGCIESYVGSRYLIKKLKSRGKTITLESLDRAAERGEGFAIEFWKDVGTKLGIMLAGVINLLNPERIVIGGGVANAGRFIFDPLKETVRRRAMKIQAKTVKIVRAKLGEDAGVIGASVLAKLKGA